MDDTPREIDPIWIVCPTGVPADAKILDLETGEPLKNVLRIVIDMQSEVIPESESHVYALVTRLDNETGTIIRERALAHLGLANTPGAARSAVHTPTIDGSDPAAPGLTPCGGGQQDGRQHTGSPAAEEAAERQAQEN